MWWVKCRNNVGIIKQQFSSWSVKTTKKISHAMHKRPTAINVHSKVKQNILQQLQLVKSEYV